MNTPYSSSESNESDIVNRQSGGKKLKYVLKFYICAMTIQHVNEQMIWGGISRKPVEIETWVQRTTNRKWTIASPMGT